jgi:hypothetical protein
MENKENKEKNEKNEKIFIQIASYRDPELFPTVSNCIKNADNPENLVFAICWQKDDKESLGEYENDARFKLLRFHYNESKGACWARNKIQDLYENEEYTLQLDSHHRFVKGWDTILKDMLVSLREKGYEKPLITSYLPSYDPENDPENRSMVPTKIHYKESTHDGSILFGSSFIDNHNKLTEPIKALFYSAHFCFTTGDFCRVVKHDPNYYFTGEEMNITVRSYTNGYDLFHPHIIIAWHEYTRKNRVKQWDDNKEWWKIDRVSKMRNRIFFNNELIGDDKISNKEEYFGDYWFGNKRSIKDYEKYSGISLKIDYETINKKNESTKNNKLPRINYKYEFDIPQYTNLKFLYLGFQDTSEKELHRIDITDFTKTKIVAEFESSQKPFKYIWWPYYNETGWGEKVDIVIK